MNVVVTGGAGFVGSHLAERLAAAGHQVVLFDSFTKTYAPAIKRRNVAVAAAMPNCTLIEGDILHEQRLDSVLSPRAVDVVAHLAGVTGEHVSLESARACIESNISGTLTVLEQCRKHRVPRLLFTSSSAVYGAHREGACGETAESDRPLSPYGASKKAAETLCHLYHHLHGLQVTIARLFSVYGPRQRPDQRVHKFGKRLFAGEPVQVAGDGSSAFDLVYIDDAVEALVRAVENVQGFEVVNIGTGKPTRTADLARAVGAALGIEPTLEFGDPDPTDAPFRVADTSKAERLLGWVAFTELRDGLRRWASWFRAQDFEDEA